MGNKALSKPWKIFGCIILAVIAVLIVFDFTVWIVYKIQWNKYTEIYREAREAGYPDGYDICTRQGNIVIDGKEYLLFEAHREVWLDGDYYENLIVSVDDEYDDKYPDSIDNLEIFAKKLEYVADTNQERYTLIDVYMIDLCRQRVSGDWCWRALGVTIIVAPVILVAGLVWLIHFVLYKRKLKAK
ncbi:MAG: hypothetical protein IJO70_02925 [Lachnospiraceae bacterium]|nr:hypothetical protein [Lachnospiraceae bacterium]